MNSIYYMHQYYMNHIIRPLVLFIIRYLLIAVFNNNNNNNFLDMLGCWGLGTGVTPHSYGKKKFKYR